MCGSAHTEAERGGRDTSWDKRNVDQSAAGAWGQVPTSPDISTVVVATAVVAGNTYLALTASQVPFSALCECNSHSSEAKTEVGALIVPTDKDSEPQRH